MINLAIAFLICITVIFAIALTYQCIVKILNKQHAFYKEVHTVIKSNPEAQTKLDENFEKEQRQVFDMAREIQKLFLTDEQLTKED